jgi:spermidine/putrescine transport system ATP-binding protein
MSMPHEHTGDLVLAGLTKRFGGFVAVDDLDLTVPQGAFFALLGPSGCGKTTTLRMVAGLEDVTGGTIRLGDEDITHRKPYRRPVNTVFQSYALFPHLTIFENVAFGLRRQGRKDVKVAVDEMLELVELGEYAARRPAQLSGGQQQRVALARALINRPQVLLLDEPLGSTRPQAPRQMQIELKRIQTEVGITFVHVTHDQEEAMTMADTVAVMNAGVIEQMGSPVELYEHPSTTFVANFLGQSNLIRGSVAGVSGSRVDVGVEGSKVRAPLGGPGTESGGRVGGGPPGEAQPVRVRLRAGRQLQRPAQREGDRRELHGGEHAIPHPDVMGQEMMVFEQNTGARGSFRVGDIVDLHWLPDHTFLLEAAQDVTAGVEREDAS